MNTRLIRLLKKYGKEIDDGTWLDCYSNTINRDVCGTILTGGVDYRNLYFVAVREKNGLEQQTN